MPRASGLLKGDRLLSFNTIPFLAFLALTVVLHYIVPRKGRNPVLLAASLAFYLFGTTPGFVVFLVLSALITWCCGNRVAAAEAPRRRLWLILGAGFQIGLLCFFKYNHLLFPQLANWLGGLGFAYAAQTAGGAWRILLPMGISYYSFQSLTYVLDLAKRKNGAAPERSFVDFLLFVSFFPQIISGPIGWACELLPQYKAARNFNPTLFTDGLRLMLIGFFKKIAVADMLAMVINPVFADQSAYTGLTLMATVVLYAFYLYCDFSGYSDIARGCAALFGIALRENFNTPYLSTSFVELWRRWHMSLSAWLREYVYIGLLGGNRKGKVRKYFNVLFTFIISGLWHGVGLPYFIWGSLQGVFQMIENFLRDRGKYDLEPKGWRFWPRVVLVFLLNAWTLTIFRAPTLADSLAILTRQFTQLSLGDFIAQFTALIGQGFNATPILMAAYVAFCVLTLGLVIAADLYRYFRLRGGCLAEHLGAQRVWVRWLVYYGMLALIFAAFLMQNGNYVGSVSFAYGGF